MISSITSTARIDQALPTQNTTQAKPQTSPKTDAQDSVHLSQKAQAQATGDVDHDGDGH